MSDERTLARGAINELFWHSVWTYVFAAIQNGDFALLRTIGIGTEQVRRLSTLSIQQLQRAIQSGGGVVHLHIDAERLEEMMRTLERHRLRDQMQERCTRLGAPLAMMTMLFGIKSKEYRALQARYAVHSPAGRPPHCTPEAAERIFRSWEASGCKMTAGALLRTADDTGLPLLVIWRELSSNQKFREQLAATSPEQAMPTAGTAAEA